MKRNNRLFAVVIVVAIAMGSIILVSCDKTETISTGNRTFTTNSAESIPEEELLSAELNVAYIDGELVDGNELQLTFDKDIFLESYEEILSEETGKQWVAENVKAYAQMMQTGETLPILQVSAFDIDDEKGSNTFIILRHSNSNTSEFCNTLCFCADIAVTVTCTATGSICTSDDKFCHLIKTETGGLNCSWCPDEGCTRTETATVVLQSICRAIRAAL